MTEKPELRTEDKPAANPELPADRTVGVDIRRREALKRMAFATISGLLGSAAFLSCKKDDSPVSPPAYSSTSSYSNYADHSSYANYSNHSSYSNYSNHSSYSNYSNHSSYSNYSNYSNYYHAYNDLYSNYYNYYVASY